MGLVRPLSFERRKGACDASQLVSPSRSFLNANDR